MTLATKITIFRIFLAPVFAFFAIAYGLSISGQQPNEMMRLIALAVFIIASLSDWLDGWLARNRNQYSELGAFLDPAADKTLVLTAIVCLTFFHWGPNGWSIPIWFTAAVWLREVVILGGLYFLKKKKLNVAIQPHWTGKVCTFCLLFVLAWIMLKTVNASPVFPCALATFFLIWSTVAYVQQGLEILKSSKNVDCIR